MDRNVDVRTPESIAFRFELAGLGSRCLAVCVDIIIQITILVLIAWGLTALASHVGPLVKSSSADDKLGESLAIALLSFILFMVLYGYYILFEAFWNGQTPGKKLLGIRVVRDGGYPLDFAGSFMRNLIRIAEMALGFYAIAAISSLLSPENKRVGDYAAGTIVVRESKLEKPLGLREVMELGERRSSAYITDDERNVIAQFLARRNALDGRRRMELADRLATRLRDRAPADLRHLPDEELLERI